MIGQSLEQIRKDLRLMPTPALVQYKQNPSKQAIEGIPMDMLAGLELSRRAELQQAQMARMAPSAQMPTVVDQQAMGLMGMAQQPAVNPAMPSQAPQFAAQQAPAPQQAAQQPMQALEQPQGAQMPMQPTQQQPKKMAVGGIVTLGDRMDANDQSTNYPTPYPPGQPVMMMARGGIVAFAAGSKEPVNANIPVSNDDENELNRLEAARNALREQLYGRRQGILAKMQSGTPNASTLQTEYDAANQAYQNKLKERQQRLLDAGVGGRATIPAIRGTSRVAPVPNPEVQRQIAAIPPVATPSNAPNAATAGPVTPNDIETPQTVNGGSDVSKLIAQMNAGGGSQFDATKVQAMIDKSAAPTDAETKYQNLVDEESARLKARPSPEVSEADRKRIIDEQFQQYQAASKPYYDQMQKMIDEERAAIKERYADKAADAMIRAGLRGLSARKPGMQGFFEGATEGMDYYDKASELEAAANSKARQAQMDLAKSRMADEKGDRKAAQEYFDSYQRNRREAETYEVTRANMLVNAQKGVVDVEGKRERAGMAMQLGLERAIRESEDLNQAVSIYAMLAPARARIKRVVLLGPTHRVAVYGLALPGVDAFATPLGLVKIDTDTVKKLMQLAFVGTNAEAHRMDHSLEEIGRAHV